MKDNKVETIPVSYNSYAIYTGRDKNSLIGSFGIKAWGNVGILTQNIFVMFYGNHNEIYFDTVTAQENSVGQKSKFRNYKARDENEVKALEGILEEIKLRWFRSIDGNPPLHKAYTVQTARKNQYSAHPDMYHYFNDSHAVFRLFIEGKKLNTILFYPSEYGVALPRKSINHVRAPGIKVIRRKDGVTIRKNIDKPSNRY